nr:hypothetical protein [Bartonella doshiae]
MTGALQIIYSLAASQLEVQNLTPQPHNLCPACNGTHSASFIIKRKPHEAIRFVLAFIAALSGIPLLTNAHLAE